MTDVIDADFLNEDFNPFKPVCEVGADPRSISLEYRSYWDYLTFLKIIADRIVKDSKEYEKITVNDPHELIAAYRLQLDIESFVIFSHILLDKVGILVEKLLNMKTENSSYHFKDHKKFFVQNHKICIEYSNILSELHWYDQNFDFLRNKIIEHSRGLAGSMRNFKFYRKTGKNFGGLTTTDQVVVQSLINKYGIQNQQIALITPNPNTMLEEFLELIMEYNIKLSGDDKKKLGEIVQRSGATIDVAILSRHIRKFLNDTASLFPRSRK